MEVCAVKDRANNGSNLATRFAPHHLVSEPQVAHGTADEMADASSPRRSYWRLSSDFLLEDEGYGAELFHTYCKVGERACATTIDHDSTINAVGVDMVEKLELSTTPHPQPYSLRRCHDQLDIRQQTMVKFSIDKFSCEILCDVIPVPMVSCYLLLGEPWYKENKVVYNFPANTYTITGDKIYVLKAMEKKPFTAWRKDRLQRMKEQEREKKIKAKAAEENHAPVQSKEDVATETGLKPRTVSFEEGEDDTVHRILKTSNIDPIEPKHDVKKLDISLHGIRRVQAPRCMDEPESFFDLPRTKPYQVKYESDLIATARCVSLEDWITTNSGFLFLFVPVKEKYKEIISCYLFGPP